MKTKYLRGIILGSLLTGCLTASVEAVSLNDFTSGTKEETTGSTVNVGAGTYEFDSDANGSLLYKTGHNIVLEINNNVTINGNNANLSIKNLTGSHSVSANGVMNSDGLHTVAINDLNLNIQRADAYGLCFQASNGSKLLFNGGTLTINMTNDGALSTTDVTDVNKKGIRGMKTLATSSGAHASQVFINTDKFTNINTTENIGLLLEAQGGPIYVNSNEAHEVVNENAIIQLSANKIARATGYAHDIPSSITLNLTNADSYIDGMVNILNRQGDYGAVKSGEGLIRVLLQDGARWTVRQGAKNINDVKQNEYAFSNKVSRLTLTSKNTEATGYVELKGGTGGAVTTLAVNKYDGNTGDLTSSANKYGVFDMTDNADHRVTIYSFIQNDGAYLLQGKGGNLRLDYKPGRSEYVDDQGSAGKRYTYQELWGVNKYDYNSSNLVVRISEAGALETAHESSVFNTVHLDGDNTTLRVFNEADNSPLTIKNLIMNGSSRIDLGTMFSELSGEYPTTGDASHDTMDNEARAHKVTVDNLLAPKGLEVDFVQGTARDLLNVNTQAHQNVLGSTANLQTQLIQGDIKVRANEYQSLNLGLDANKTMAAVINGNLIRTTDEGGTDAAVVNAQVVNGTWNMTADNRLNALQLDKDGNIGWGTKAKGSPYNVLTIADLSGQGGTVNFTSAFENFAKDELDENYSDIVKITNSSNVDNALTLRFRDNLKGVVDHWYGGDGIRVVQGLTQPVAINTFVAGDSILSTYNLLGEFRANEADPTKFDYVITNVKTDPSPSPVVAGGETLLNAHLLGYRNREDTLLKRMGELRQHDAGEGTWARYQGSKYESSKFYDSTTKSQNYEFGYDNRIDHEDGTVIYNGVAINYTTDKTSFGHEDLSGSRFGSGEGAEYGLAYYDTRLGTKGHYLDLMAKASYLTHDIDLTDTHNSYTGAGEYKHWAYSVGAEYGRQIVDKQSQWYVEPQAQMTLALIRGAKTTVGDKLVVDQNTFGSAIGRLGVVVGRKVKNGQAYLKGSMLHEFAGRSGFDFLQTTTGGRRHTALDLHGTWFELGVGANIKLANKTFAHLDLEKSCGSSDYKMPWRFTGGINWKW